MVNPNAAAQASVPLSVIILGGVLGAAKLVAVGICLAIGFSIGNLAIRKFNDLALGWYYARQERKHEPPEEDHDNGGLSGDASSEEAGS